MEKSDVAGRTATSSNDQFLSRLLAALTGKDASPGKGQDGKLGASPKPGREMAGDERTGTKKADPDPVPVALELGWTMALLYGESQDDSAPQPDRLPTEHELPPVQRTRLEAERAKALLGRLRMLLGELVPEPAGNGLEFPHLDDAPDHDLLKQANLDILTWLACAGRDVSLAYQLGRSLRDTARPPLRAIEVDGAPGDWAVAMATAVGRFAEARTAEATAVRKKMLLKTAGLSLPGLSLADLQQVEPASRADCQQKLKDAADKLAKLFAVQIQLARGRVSKLQEWLITLDHALPDDSAAIVGASIGRWSDLVTTIYDPVTPGRLRGSKSAVLPSKLPGLPAKLPTAAPVKKGLRKNVLPSGEQDLTTSKHADRYPSGVQVAGRLHGSLLGQGDAWLNLLIGAQSLDDLLTPEGYVAAGEAALGRSARIIRRIAVHYWFLLLVVAAALGGIIYLAVSDLSGASKVWTQIAAVAGALGITSKGIASRMAKLSQQAETSVFSAERTDAMAWAITYIPANLKLDRRGVKALRSSGIRGSVPLGRV